MLLREGNLVASGGIADIGQCWGDAPVANDPERKFDFAFQLFRYSLGEGTAARLAQFAAIDFAQSSRA